MTHSRDASVGHAVTSDVWPRESWRCASRTIIHTESFNDVNINRVSFASDFVSDDTRGSHRVRTVLSRCPPDFSRSLIDVVDGDWSVRFVDSPDCSRSR